MFLRCVLPFSVSRKQLLCVGCCNGYQGSLEEGRLTVKLGIAGWSDGGKRALGVEELEEGLADTEWVWERS